MRRTPIGRKRKNFADDVPYLALGALSAKSRDEAGNTPFMAVERR